MIQQLNAGKPTIHRVIFRGFGVDFRCCEALSLLSTLSEKEHWEWLHYLGKKSPREKNGRQRGIKGGFGASLKGEGKTPRVRLGEPSTGSRRGDLAGRCRAQCIWQNPAVRVGYSNMSINVPRPFPKMGTLLDLQNGYIHLKDPKRVHCCTSGKQAENGYITRLLGKNVNNDTLSPPPPFCHF